MGDLAEFPLSTQLFLRARVTASSHHRAFLVEVMGRDCGYLALMVTIAGGAEAVLLPETATDPEALARELRDAYARRKRLDPRLLELARVLVR